MCEKTLSELKALVLKFDMLELPGQMPMMHMGTSYLVHDLLSALEALERERDKLRKLDQEAATYVESVICMRTHFTGEPPYVGWKGLGLALNEVLDERDTLRTRVAALEAEVARLGLFVSSVTAQRDLLSARVAGLEAALGSAYEDAAKMVDDRDPWLANCIRERGTRRALSAKSEGAGVGTGWMPIETRPDTDDLMWFCRVKANGDYEIYGPHGAYPNDVDWLTHWAPCKSPPPPHHPLGPPLPPAPDQGGTP